MTNAEPTSTDSTNSARTADSQAPLIAVSEENLAALLRATNDAPEPEQQETVIEEIPEAEAQEEAVTEIVKSAPQDPVASGLALLAAAREHRSEILQAAVTPIPVAQKDYPAASLPQTAAPQVTPAAPPRSHPAKPQPAIAVAPAESPAPSRTKLAIGGGIGAVIVVVGLILLWPKPHAPKPPAVLAVAPPQDDAPLKLLAEPLGSGLINVRWNAQSTAVMQARDGRLVITEHGKAPRIMALDPAQLKIGHLAYPTSAESIQFDLEVNNVGGTVAKESILALSSPVAPTPQVARQPAAVAKPPEVPQVAPPKVQAAAPPVVQTTTEVAQTKVRAFVPPPTQQKKAQNALIDAPPALASVPVTPLGVNVPATLTPLAPPPAPKQIQVESKLQAANLIKKVVPVYPLLARSAGIQGVVRFTALIGKDGKIRDVKFVGGPPPLVDAATDAVKRWVYRPTLLNGQPVEVITEINVNFTINGTAR